jgi:signal peptidase I
MNAMEADDYYTTAICRAMKRLGSIEIRSKGTSMFPFIREGDTCFFRSFEPDQVRPGDALLFVNDTGTLVCHRVVEIKKDPNPDSSVVYICKGDTNRYPDKPVSAGQVVGKLTHIRKKHFTLSPDKGFGRLWGKLVMNLPPFAYILHRVAIYYRWRSNHLSTRH